MNSAKNTKSLTTAGLQYSDYIFALDFKQIMGITKSIHRTQLGVDAAV